MSRQKMREKFYDCLSKRSLKCNSFLMSTVKYQNLLQEVKVAKNGEKKLNRHYWLLRHYDVLTVDGRDHLIAPLSGDGQILYYIPREDLFDVLYDTHELVAHGGRDRMRKELQRHYKNITGKDIQMFLNFCKSCMQKRKSEKRGLEVQPMMFTNSRCQVDLIDYQSQADGEYKFIMVYQDQLTKFIVLRPLKSNEASEVSQHLIDIFLLFGAPIILQSHGGRKFCNNIIENLKILWPQLKIINGKSLDTQPGGSVGKGKQDIQNMVTKWTKDNNCSNWSRGLGFVQLLKNQTLQTDVRQSPYEAMFGQPANVGLTTTSLPSDIIQKINTEEDLERILQKIKEEEEETQLKQQIEELEDPEFLQEQFQENSIFTLPLHNVKTELLDEEM